MNNTGKQFLRQQLSTVQCCSLIFRGIFFIAIVSANFSSLAFAIGIQTPIQRSKLYQGEFKTGLAGSYYLTKRNFNENGERTALGTDSDFWNAKGTAVFLLGATDDLAALGNFQYVYNAVHTPRVDSYYSGLGDGSLGAHYEPKGAPLPIMVDLEFLFPMYSRLGPSDWAKANGSGPTPAGNGINEISLVGTAELPLGKYVHLGIGGGYAYLSSGFSGYLPFRSYLKYEELRYFILSFGVIGQLSTQTDAFTNNTVAQDRSSNILGGSKVYNSINPTYLNMHALAGIYVTPEFFINADLQAEIFGQNTSQGLGAAIAAGYHFGAPPAERRKDLGLDRTYGNQSSNRGFQEYELRTRIVQANNDINQHLVGAGKNQGVREGEYLDIFEPPKSEFEASGDAVARAIVLEAGPTRSKVEIKEFFTKRKIEEGFVVRRPVR